MSDQKPLGREAILASKSSRKSKVVDVEGLGPIRVMAPDAKGSLFIGTHRQSPDSLGASFIAVIVDENGDRVFELTDEAASEAMSLPGDVVLTVINAANSLAGPEVEAEIKNSPASPISDSPTD